MRILLVNDEYSVSGASLMLLRVARHLRRAGHEIVIFTRSPAPGPILETYRAEGFTVTRSFMAGAFDVAICNTVYCGLMVQRIAPHTKTIWWLREAETGLEFLLKLPAAIKAFRQATALIFQTAFQRDSIYRSFIYDIDPARLFVVPNGLDIDAAAIEPREKRRPRLVAIGAIRPLKRQGDLIRAVERLADRDLECVIIGRLHELDDEARRIAAAAPERHRLLGALPNPTALSWLRSADVFCLPSESESQPVTALEAGALGRALVLSDLPVHDGIWRHGRNCLVHPVGDVALIAHSIAMLLDDAALRQRLGSAAEATARGFGEAAFFARIEGLLDQVVGEERRGPMSPGDVVVDAPGAPGLTEGEAALSLPRSAG